MSYNQYHQQLAPLKDKLYRFALRIVGNEAEAEDVVQEVYIKLWRKQQLLPTIKNLEAWCMTMVKNMALDKLKLKKQKTESLESAYHVSSNGATPEEHTESLDTMEIIQKTFSALPDNQRLAIHLRDIEGMSYQEIAQAMQTSLEQVKTHIHRGRQALKVIIHKYNFHE